MSGQRVLHSRPQVAASAWSDGHTAAWLFSGRHGVPRAEEQICVAVLMCGDDSCTHVRLVMLVQLVDAPPCMHVATTSIHPELAEALGRTACCCGWRGLIGLLLACDDARQYSRGVMQGWMLTHLLTRGKRHCAWHAPTQAQCVPTAQP